MTQDKKCILILELGHLIVFHYQTLDEYASKIQPIEVFWQKKGDTTVQGPFPTIWHAVNHYGEAIAPKAILPANVINIDFKAKKRMT